MDLFQGWLSVNSCGFVIFPHLVSTHSTATTPLLGIVQGPSGWRLHPRQPVRLETWDSVLETWESTVERTWENLHLDDGMLKKNGAVFYRLPGWRPASILPRSRGHQRGQDFLEDDVRCCWVGSSRWWTWRVWRVIFDRLFHHNLDKRKKTLGTFVRRIWRFPKMNFHFHFHRHCWENIPRKWRVWVRESHVFAWNGGGFFWEGITWYH